MLNIASNGLRTFLSALIVLSLGACSTVEKHVPDQKADYKTSRTEPLLEVPPGLSTVGQNDRYSIPGGASASYSEYSQAHTGSTEEMGVLPVSEKIEVKREGDKRWLVVHAAPEKVWERARTFWVANGINLEREDPAVGIMETEWLENRADIPADPIRKLLKNSLDILYSAATRDKFRVRLERAGDTTEVYLTHRGVKEVVRNKSTGTTMWVDRPTDPELEAEMLSRMMVSMGVDESRARAQLAQGEDGSSSAGSVTMIDTGEKLLLELEEGFSTSWRKTGQALDRVGFAVIDRNRTSGIYYVQYNDVIEEQKKDGWLSSLAFWSDDEEEQNRTTVYQVQLVRDGTFVTNIIVNTEDGIRLTDRTAKRILTLLYEQLQ